MGFGVIEILAGEFRLLLAVALGVLAGHKLLPELQLHPVAGLFMGDIVVAVRDQLHLLDVGARPDDMEMLSAVGTAVKNDSPGLVLKP